MTAQLGIFIEIIQDIILDIICIEDIGLQIIFRWNNAFEMEVNNTTWTYPVAAWRKPWFSWPPV